MPKITTFLTYDHGADEAAKLYTSIFKNSKVTATTYYSEGAPLPKGTVMTVAFELDGQPFVALNGGEHFKFTDAMSLWIAVETQAEIDNYSERLIAGGGKQGPCGWLTDRFGVSWQITPTSLGQMLSDKDRAKSARVMKVMMQMQRLDLAQLKQAYEG